MAESIDGSTESVDDNRPTRATTGGYKHAAGSRRLMREFVASVWGDADEEKIPPGLDERDVESCRP